MNLPSDIDPIRFEVIRNAWVAACEEMALTLRRSAYSTNIKTRADFSCALFDQEARCVAQSFSQPVHLGSMAMLVREAINKTSGLDDGDVVITNDPYLPGSHLNDITLIAPIYFGGSLAGYAANLAHHVDVGGGAPASIGAFREIYQEGVIIPPTKLARAGVLDDGVLDLLLAQVRSTFETRGDLRAQLAANKTGAWRVQEMLEKVGLNEAKKYLSFLLEYTERRTRQAIADLPDGRYHASGSIDWDGYSSEPVRLEATVAIDGSRIAFDLSGSDPQRRAPVNSTFAHSVAACAYVLKCLTDPDIPVNEGFYRCVSVTAPERSVVNCAHPAPVVGTGETQVRLTDVLFKAMSDAMPDAVPAGTKAMICHAGFGGVDPAGLDYFCFLETLAGGYGGRMGSDGPDAVQAHGQNTENAPIEETERRYPVRILRYELVPNSEGAGQFRGGLGLRRDYMFPDRSVTFTVLADRDVSGPWGLFGGLAGRPAEYVLNPGDHETRLRSKTTLDLQQGDVVSYRTCGGGGFGPPLERDVEAVARDVAEERITLERAEHAYGVVIGEDGTPDMESTRQLRGLTPPALRGPVESAP